MSSFSTEHRKLAAIMFTDMVGWSALTQRNGKLTLELIAEHRQLMRSVFPNRQRPKIEPTGDGLLVEVGDALAAVECAVEIKQLLRQRNESLSTERRVLLAMN